MAPFRNNRINFSRTVKVLSGVLLGGAILWYGVFQARFLIAGPQVTLETPAEITQYEQLVYVRGVARNVTALTLNGRTIRTDETGYFNELLVLPEGYTIMSIHAEDRYGRSRSLQKTLVYTPSPTISLIPK